MLKIWNNYEFDYLSFLRSLDAFGRVKSFFLSFRALNWYPLELHETV